MNKSLLRKILTLCAVASVILANVLTSVFPFNNHTNAQVTEQFRVHFVPTGYVFNIWWVIYALLAGFALYQFISDKKYEEKLNKIFPWFMVSCILNFVWLFLWHSEFFLPTIGIMLLLSYALLRINMIIREGNKTHDFKSSLLLHTTFSVYFGWIAVSTSLTAVDVVWHLGFNGLMLTGQVWAAIMTVFLSLFGAYMLIKKEDVLFAAVVVWALVGIWINFPYVPLVNYTLLIVSVALGLLLGSVLGLRLTRILLRYS